MIYSKILHILGRNWWKFSNWCEGFIDIDKLDFFLSNYENWISWKLPFSCRVMLYINNATWQIICDF